LALNPLHAVSFMLHHGVIGFVTLGAVFLAVTGAEALYADLGHFGKRPIQTAWLYIVLPSLALNYLGQGSLIIGDPRAVENLEVSVRSQNDDRAAVAVGDLIETGLS
jgi:KUP system potassium uptake protein